MKSKLLTFFLCISLLPVSCVNTPEPDKKSAPEWVNSVPLDEKYFYAVGISGPTRNIKDAWNQAIQRARAELGKTIITHITSQDLIISTTDGEYSSQLIQALSDTELNFTEVIERWYDRSGIYGLPEFYYVLVRLERKRAEMLLKGLK
ncbi:MAG: LPP20 family lipoprotein [Desulfobacterales bacterium]|nr:LPP20 family lipoprotein [Deltaproteobacteria bacterium]NNL43669.1 LPP20 family lipoprotein [Desulfobacterales bacterium]